MQPLADHQAQPEEQRELRIAQIIVQALDHLDVGVLDHVRGVEASLQARVEAHLHHAAQAVAMLGEEGVPGLPVPRPGTLDQVHGSRPSCSPSGVPIPYYLRKPAFAGRVETRFFEQCHSVGPW